LRTSSVIRSTAWAVVAIGVAAPLVRRRLRLPPPAVIGAAAAVPAALCVAVPRSRSRDALVCFMQMYAYVAAYKMPHDDPEALERRVHVDYPVRIDRVLGLGRLPTLRLQHAFGRPGSFSRPERVLVWAHWIWFAVPHGTVAYHLVCHRERFPRAAVLTYAVFDLGAIVYWALPTAPPWYAAEHGRAGNGDLPAVRRMMVEYGEQFWGRGWGPLYSVLGGNPLAAMPSLHFATTLMAAHLLSELGPLHAAAGWAYCVTLGTALVYLGEHYVIDLIAGAALTEAIRRRGPRFAPALLAVSRGIRALETRAQE
jgi:membrane-associated phospholipid phosphatase